MLRVRHALSFPPTPALPPPCPALPLSSPIASFFLLFIYSLMDLVFLNSAACPVPPLGQRPVSLLLSLSFNHLSHPPTLSPSLRQDCDLAQLFLSLASTWTLLPNRQQVSPLSIPVRSPTLSFTLLFHPPTPLLQPSRPPSHPLTFLQTGP
jgi:hypothetical protein